MSDPRTGAELLEEFTAEYDHGRLGNFRRVYAELLSRLSSGDRAIAELESLRKKHSGLHKILTDAGVQEHVAEGEPMAGMRLSLKARLYLLLVALRWIPVAERLPEAVEPNGKYYRWFQVTDGELVDMAILMGGKFEGNRRLDATHWREIGPLPEISEVKTTKGEIA